MAEVFLGLGSNLGDKASNIRHAVTLLQPHCESIELSRLYKTAPVGYLDQDWFLNAVARAQTRLTPTELLQVIQRIENELKRQRTIPNGPRTIDIDILFYGELCIDDGPLIVPHPRLHERAFVLVPMAELAPKFRHPVLRQTIAALLADCPSDSSAVEIYQGDR